jgi:hypothetical protein
MPAFHPLCDHRRRAQRRILARVHLVGMSLANLTRRPVIARIRKMIPSMKTAAMAVLHGTLPVPRKPTTSYCTALCGQSPHHSFTRDFSSHSPVFCVSASIQNTYRKVSIEAHAWRESEGEIGKGAHHEACDEGRQSCHLSIQ